MQYVHKHADIESPGLVRDMISIEGNTRDLASGPWSKFNPADRNGGVVLLDEGCDRSIAASDIEYGRARGNLRA